MLTFMTWQGGAPIEDRLRENRLRWFERLCRRPTNAVVSQSNIIIDSDSTRERGRSKLIFRRGSKKGYDQIESR